MRFVPSLHHLLHVPGMYVCARGGEMTNWPGCSMIRARLSVRHPAIAKKPSVWRFGDGAEEASLSAARRTPPNIRHKCSAAR